MRAIKSKPWRRCYGYVVRARPRADHALSLIEVNPATQKCVTSVGEELVMESERLVALAERCCEEQAAIVIRTWAHVDYTELVELHRAPWAGWTDPTKTETEAF